MEYSNIILAALLVFVINLPFGAWRANLKKFSFLWFVSIHLPIPAVVAIRFGMDIGFAFYTYPIMVAAFFSGQFGGKLLERRFNLVKLYILKKKEA